MRLSDGHLFYKLTGSGNDFVFFDGRITPLGDLESREAIVRICARGTGIGADGIVYIFSHPNATVAIRYYNADGSRAALCGNATLCTTSLIARLGEVDHSDILIATDSGVLQARIHDGHPEFDLPLITDVRPAYQVIPMTAGEVHLGYATAGVPHVVIQMDDVANANLIERGRSIRYHSSFPHGSNVNFVSKCLGEASWMIRTYERGVESETLACGTGIVAAAILLKAWAEVAPEDDVILITKSGLPITVRLRRDARGWHASLQGEGRLVFVGELQ